ncbi:MAG TPA: hypothetical protein VI702_05370 [Nitrospiria bacterium]
MKVAALTVEELMALIKEAVHEELRWLLGDPDKGLELRHVFEERLQASLSSTEQVPFEEVEKRFKLP